MERIASTTGYDDADQIVLVEAKNRRVTNFTKPAML